MKILIIGSGGREHALAWKMAQSPRCEQLWIAPGNAGTASLGTNVPIGVSDFDGLRALIDQEGIEMMVVGPEQPLVDGITDAFADHPVLVVGPNQRGAELEGSKEFSKRFMQKYRIPTAAYASFDSHQIAEAEAYIAKQSLPVVVKASGLAAGKGVLICESHAEAQAATREMLSGSSFGEAGTTVVIEEFLQGIEISIFVLTDGKDYVLLPSAKDYKRIGEGDTGLNTGGMGAVSPVPFADQAFVDEVEQSIVQPTVRGLQTEGIDYRGFIFIGLMVVNGKAYVLEYNVRMGDPETEVVLPRLEADLVDVMESVAQQKLDQQTVSFRPETCTTVMLVSGGYPGKYEKGKAMSGFDQTENSILFHAGTKALDGQILTNGGRVLAISSLGPDIQTAVAQSLANADKIQFEGKFFRRDIGQDLMD
ncbi:MAG: phosphoribosylamine--glycine ligase [Bacteroidota bacterium]